jgi:anti-anti-sigma regulatory factor
MERGAEEGGEQNAVQIAGMRPDVAGVLQRTGLDALFPSHPDRESALAAF